MRRPLATPLLGALLSLLLLTGPASAQQAGGGGSTIQGAVVDPSGTPLAGVHVLAYDDDDTWYGGDHVTTGPDGTYSLEGLDAGEYRILFHGQAAGFATQWADGSATRAGSPTVTVGDGATRTGVDATLGRGSSISGTVAGHGGDPLGDVVVWAYADSDGVVGTAAARSAADGTFEIGGLPAGAYRVLFVAPTGSGLTSEWWDDRDRRADAAPVAVTPAAGATDVDAVLEITAPPGEEPMRYRDAVFSDVVTTSDVPYAEVTTRQGDPVTLLADIYQPQGDTVAARPAMILVHGGSFRAGAKTSPELVDQANVLAAKGYVVASISYRLSPTGCGADEECLLAITDAQADAQAAVRWLRANAATYGVDPDRIAIGGSSAGAITALNVAYNADDPLPGPLPEISSRVQAAVSISGSALPWDAVGPGDAPALLFHNEVDPLVSNDWARSTVDSARAAGLVAELVTYEGVGHVPYAANRAEILDTTTNFLYRMLDLAAADHGSAAAVPIEALASS